MSEEEGKENPQTEVKIVKRRRRFRPKSKRSDYETIRKIGFGSFSKVFLVEDKITKKKYAIKTISKISLYRNRDNKTKMVINEKKSFLRLRHRNIIKLHKSFQDYENLCLSYLHKFFLPHFSDFLLEYAPYGELFYVLKYFKKFPEEIARFYIAQIILGMEYMHQNKVVHLDLKPENILLDENLHIKIIDFGTAIFLDNLDDKIYCIGTPEYISPEIIKKTSPKTVTPACDIWSLGIILYQFLTGHCPFKSSSPFLIYQMVKKMELSYPPDVISEQAKDLLTKILVLEPSKRLGVKNISEIKNHIFFSGLDWENIHKSKPPQFDNLLNAVKSINQKHVDHQNMLTQKFSSQSDNTEKVSNLELKPQNPQSRGRITSPRLSMSSLSVPMIKRKRGSGSGGWRNRVKKYIKRKKKQLEEEDESYHSEGGLGGLGKRVLKREGSDGGSLKVDNLEKKRIKRWNERKELQRRLFRGSESEGKDDMPFKSI